jgi:hypothetical protein
MVDAQHPGLLKLMSQAVDKITITLLSDFFRMQGWKAPVFARW